MTTPRKVFFALALLDAASVFVVFNVVSFARGLSAGPLTYSALIVPYLILTFAIYLIDGYRSRTDMLSLDYTSEHVIALLSALLTTLLLTFVLLPSGYELQSSRIVIALSYVVLIPLTLSYRRILCQRMEAARVSRSIVFIGDEASYQAFRDECERLQMVQPLIYANAEPTSEQRAGAPARSFGEIIDGALAGKISVEAIVLRESARELQPEVSRKLVELYFSGLPTYTLELFHQVYWRKIPLYRLNQTWLFQEGFPIAREPVFERLKRATDIVLASIGIALAAPVVFLGALAVWLESGRPIFFKQKRIGRNQVPFVVRKLRSMRVGSDKGDLYTRPDDQRVTRVGRFLRATRIDEFPQLWNVLRGDMSLIGPRAEWDRLVENYQCEIPCYHFRHLVKPGITGWAQINYPYGASLEDTLRKLEYDLYYIRHFSFRLDAAIILKTVHVILFGKGQ